MYSDDRVTCLHTYQRIVIVWRMTKTQVGFPSKASSWTIHLLTTTPMEFRDTLFVREPGKESALPAVIAWLSSVTIRGTGSEFNGKNFPDAKCMLPMLNPTPWAA